MTKMVDIVRNCLAESVRARNDDWVLYSSVCKKMDIDLSGVTVESLCNNSRDYPSFESVSRARRKVQSLGQYPATEIVQKGRKIRQQEYEDFYGHRK